MRLTPRVLAVQEKEDAAYNRMHQACINDVEKELKILFDRPKRLVIGESHSSPRGLYDW